MFKILFLYSLMKYGLIILINPAKQTNPFVGVTLYFLNVAIISLSNCNLLPLYLELSITAV